MTSGNSYPKVFGQRYPQRYPEDFCGGAVPSLAALGTDLLRHWEVPAASSPLITLNGGNVSQLDDRVGTGHLVQANASLQPAYSASGGPNDAPYINIQDAARRLGTIASLGHAAGKRLGIYCVIATSGGATTETVWGVTTDADPFAGSPVCSAYQASSARGVNAKPNGAAQQNLFPITSPTLTSAWQVVSVEFLAAGMLCRIDGSSTTPNYTGSAAADTALSARIGYTANSGGKFAFACVVDNIDTTKRTVLESYINSVYGL